jgi:magnesium chelatase family protein
LFNHDILEALRQPLEGGEITIGRGDETATFPARGMMVFAANPCPCGGYSPVASLSKCECMEIRRRDYRRKLQGPVIDRIDITRHVVPPTEAERKDKLARPESSAVVRARVEEARARQAERYAGEPWRTNAQAPGPLLTDRWALSADAQHRLDGELYAGRLTSRGFVKVHRIALTVADLHGVARPGLDELDIALRLRNGEPLLSSVVERRVS